ncbi:methyltransferase domain-containing protein [Nocardiopsis composta]|uniref:Ubiquinone/menaquinone biosynthesis C-methylase UbiE n=1 Tax=Nocardiopsis composta TaxID=157465 RepID=A0A7W8QTK7_9ACTN|nr:methyltransferase domain-containing protein [Nocardiopsis composta]MBB5436279.1 ubiquinone/menaquinone biosynthesis C-methylase UbiE [Nocardiopsis composta]
MTENAPDSSKVADAYDEITTVVAKLWNGNLHYGYWDDENDQSTFGQALDRMTDEVISRLDPRPGQRILDVGCGTGSPALRLARRQEVEIVGISISPRQIEVAAEGAREAGVDDRVRYEVADAMSLPYPDDSFDGVMALESMVHMPDKVQVLREIARVLRPGGRVSIADLTVHEVSAQERYNSAGASSTEETYTMARFDEYGDLLEKAGLIPIEITDAMQNTRRSIRYFIEGALSCRDEYVKAIGVKEFEKRVEEARKIEHTPELGYALVSARNPD